MAQYELKSTIRSPGRSVVFIEFSPDGRFLAMGDRDGSLHILNRFVELRSTISTVTPARPTALVWESSTTFYVGLGDGCFVHYQIDSTNKKLREGATNSRLNGPFPVSAIALDPSSGVLVLSLGSNVYTFKRIETGEFRFVAEISGRFHPKRDPGAPYPFPKSLCFLPNDILAIAYTQQNIILVALKFDGNQLHPTFHTTEIDYSGFTLLKSIVCAREEESRRYTRFWIFDGASQVDAEAYPYLYINGGAATLSGSTTGAAVLRDVVTAREMQRLNHSAVTDRYVAAMAYHISNDKHTIATAEFGANATVKIWTAVRDFDVQGQVAEGSRVRRWSTVTILMAALGVFALTQMQTLQSTRELGAPPLQRRKLPF